MMVKRILILKLFFLSLWIPLISSINASENDDFISESKILTLNIQQDSEDIDSARKNARHPDLLLPLCIVMTEPKFLAKFHPTSQIGGGGEARVTKVKDKRTGAFYALVLSSEMVRVRKPDHRKLFIERMLENQELNLHQGKIYAYFWIANPNYPFCGHKIGVHPFKDLKEGHVLNDFYRNDPDATPYRHEAFLLELGLGDLEGTLFENLRFNPLVKNLMIAFGNYSFHKASIQTFDDKLRNYIFVESSQQTYQKQAMNEYDFLNYKVGCLNFYLPMPSHIIKRIDYGCWGIFSCHQPYEITLGTLSEACGISETELSERFCQKPADPNARILSIKTWEQAPMMTEK